MPTAGPLNLSSRSDPDNLLVENHAHPMVIGIQYEPFVVPCKPTSPKVKVELVKEDGEVTILSYNETIGFLVVGNESTDTFISCIGYVGNHQMEQSFMVAIDRRFPNLVTHVINYLIIFEHNRARLISCKKIFSITPPARYYMQSHNQRLKKRT